MKKLVLIAALTAVAIFGVMASANAASDAITINARVNSKIVVTAPGDYTFPAADPDAAAQTYSDDVNVRSNVAYNLAVAGVGDTTIIRDSGSVAGAYAKAPSNAGFDHSETWTFDPAPGGDWADAGDYTATFTYTALPQ